MLAKTWQVKWLRLIMFFTGLAFLPVLLLGCGEEDSSSLVDMLPLAENRPTFVMFYTDN